jgi:Caspase domain
MSEPEKLVQVILNIGAEGDLSQAEADALLKELEAQVGQQMAGSVEIINKKSPEESQSKGEPLMTLAIVLIQYAVPKLIELVFEVVKERRNSKVRALAKVGNEQVTIDSRTGPVELQAIQERVKATTSGDETPERRFALLIGTTSYQDSRLNQLASPEVDVQALADVLKDPSIGGYDDVNLLMNQSSLAISQAVEQFFKKKANTDLLLLYFSGHGVRDENDELYLAVQNTNLELLRATAVPSNFINVLMDRSKSERQVLILDCCYSGSFLHGSKSATGAVDVPVHAAKAFKGNGYGRVVLTATDKTQVAWEGQRVTGQVQKSVFTQHLIEGITSGEADQDSDGWIGLDELYKYVYNRMIKTAPQQSQTPEMTVFHMKGNIILARNPRPKAAVLPAELQSLITHPYADVRLTAVNRLKELFNDSPYGEALAARKALEKLSGDDSRMVSEAAAKALGILPSEKTAAAVSETSPGLTDKPIPPASSIPITVPRPGESAQEGVRVSPGAAWWTQPQLQPLPGTRSGGGTKSGPSRIQEVSTQPVKHPSAPISNVTASPASGLSNPVYPAFQSPPARKTSNWQEPDTRALLAGVLSLLLIFLPVSIWGFTVCLRAIRTAPNSPRASIGLVLSGIAIAVQLIFLFIAVMSI